SVGSFFTNVQVRIAESDGRDRLLEALRRSAHAQGLLEAHDGEPADRTVRVGPSEGGWVTVYDEATESQDTRALDALRERASRALGGHAVTVLVHDSDVLRLALFEGGRSIDRYDSAPEYFGRVDVAARVRAAGDPERWRALVEHGVIDELRSAWSDRELGPL